MEENNPQLRFDIVSKDWVIISPKRAKRPKSIDSKKICPFCKIKKEKPILFVRNSSDWKVAVIPNKYPALSPKGEPNEKTEGGIYKKMRAIGFHEVVVTRDHNRSIAKFSLDEVFCLFLAYKKRYNSLKKKKYVNYISIFHNHGKKAGASVLHPHSQIITTPLIDSDLEKALYSSKDYFEKKGECIYCRMSAWEMKVKERIVFENEDFIAITPFASKLSFQVIVSPKKHNPYFEKSTDKELKKLSEVFLSVIKKIDKVLESPDYNFYLHSAPCDNKNHDYYHYHWTIIPRGSVFAGFEVGTKIEISGILPEDAAKYLREA